MNALANNGFLPRSGIVTFADLVRAQKEGYNIDYDLGAFLAATALSLDGDLVTTKVRRLEIPWEVVRSLIMGLCLRLSSPSAVRILARCCSVMHRNSSHTSR